MPGLDDATRSGLLLRLTRQITSRHDLDDVLAEVFRCLRPVVAFGGGSIQLLDDEGWIRMAAIEPPAPAHVLAQRAPLGGSVGGRVILTESPVYLPDVDPRTTSPAHRITSGIRSYFGVPLVADGRAIGLLQIDSPQPDAWTDQERAIFVIVAPVIAAAIQNARAHAREAAARQRMESTERRLAEIQRLVVLARTCAARGEWAEAEQHLAQLDDDAEEAGRAMVRLPRPRVARDQPAVPAAS